MTQEETLDLNIDGIMNDINGKADKDLGNITNLSSVAVSVLQSALGDSGLSIKESQVSGKNGYVVFSNDFCMQWGYVNVSGNSNTITLLKNYGNTNYVVTTASGSNYGAIALTARTNNSITIQDPWNSGSIIVDYHTLGFITTS